MGKHIYTWIIAISSTSLGTNDCLGIIHLLINVSPGSVLVEATGILDLQSILEEKGKNVSYQTNMKICQESDFILEAEMGPRQCGSVANEGIISFFKSVLLNQEG